MKLGSKLVLKLIFSDFLTFKTQIFPLIGKSGNFFIHNLPVFFE
jgi:hypothetical protein